MIFLNVCDILQALREHSVTIQLRGKATAKLFCQDLSFCEMTANLFTVKATGFKHNLKPPMSRKPENSAENGQIIIPSLNANYVN